MRRALLFSIVTFYCVEVFAQPEINGIYVNKYNEYHRIELSNGRFRFIKQQVDTPQYAEEYLYAEADYEWIDDEFIEFRSDKPVNVVDSLLEIKEKGNATTVRNKCKKKIKVIIPDAYRRGLNVTVFYNGVKLRHVAGLHFYYSQTDKWRKGDTKQVSNCQAEFFVPAKTTKIYLKIEPDNISHDLIDWDSVIQYNSYIFYKTPIISLYNDYVEITVNGIDDSYFGRYYINGEYAKVTGDKIFWRGHIFEKIQD